MSAVSITYTKGTHMTTILDPKDSTDRHHLKVAILDTFALVFQDGGYPSSFAHALTAPAVKKALPADKVETFTELVQHGKSIKEIFGLFGIFDEFELTYIQNSFDGGYADRAFRELANHLRDYYIL